jgi:hypothetical protein
LSKVISITCVTPLESWQLAGDAAEAVAAVAPIAAVTGPTVRLPTAKMPARTALKVARACLIDRSPSRNPCRNLVPWTFMPLAVLLAGRRSPDARVRAE